MGTVKPKAGTQEIENHCVDLDSLAGMIKALPVRRKDELLLLFLPKEEQWRALPVAFPQGIAR